MSNPHNIQVGQELWVAYDDSRYSKPRVHSVTKVGRKWIEMGPHLRANIDTLRIDSNALGGSAYVSRDEWEQNAFLNKIWLELRAPSLLAPKSTVLGGHKRSSRAGWDRPKSKCKGVID